MKISMRLDYGVRALIYLAQFYGKRPVQTNEIAQAQGIPEPFLDQVLAGMQKAGFIRSRRGPQGGHALSHSPQEITLGAVLAALEGPFSPMECLNDWEVCPQAVSCVQRDVWQSVKEATESVLGATTIADLAQRQRSRQGRSMYYI